MTWQAVDDFPGLSVQLAPNPAGRIVIVAIKLEARPVTSEMLRRVPVARIEHAANAADDPDTSLPPLRRESGKDPAAFSRLVADHYRAWAALDPNPAARIAAKWDVKPPTMHTWIREARLRGFLPPAMRKKV